MNNIQKKLTAMGITYVYKETTAGANIKFMTLDGRDCEIDDENGYFVMTGVGFDNVPMAKGSKSQKGIIEALESVSYKFGGNQEKLDEELERLKRREALENALADRTYEDHSFGAYTLEIEKNGLGRKRFTVRRDRNQGYYLPDIYVKHDSLFSDVETVAPEVKMQTTSYGSLNIEDSQKYIDNLNVGMAALKHFDKLIQDEWGSMKIISIEDILWK